MNRQHFQLLAALGLLFLGTAVPANQVSYLIDSAKDPAPNEVIYQSTSFSIYIDPLKTNWAAWGRKPVASEVNGTIALDVNADPTVLRDAPMIVSVIDPWGQRSKNFTFGLHDDAGVPVGQQALLLGKRELTPSVFRYDAAGNPILLVEEGILDPFIASGGEGYYTFIVNYQVPADLPPQPRGPLYLVMDVVEGYRQKPPHANLRPGGIWGGSEDGDHHDDDNGLSGFFGPDDDDDNNDDDDDDDNNPNKPTNPPDDGFPPPPTPPGPNEPGPEDPEPVIPEPGTVLLIGLGTAMAAIAKRRGLIK